MPKPIVCLSEQLSQYLEAFRGCFSKRQWKYFVTVLLGLIECEERKTMTGMLRVVGEQISLSGLSRFLNKWSWSLSAVVAVWLERFRQRTRPMVQDEHERLKAEQPKRRGRPKKTVVTGYLIFDDSVHTKPKGRSMGGLGRHYSNTEKRVVSGHCLLTGLYVLLGQRCPLQPQLYRQKAVCEQEGVIFQSKIDMVVSEIEDFTPTPRTHTHVLVDSWFHCKRLRKTTRQRNWDLSGGLKSNRVMRLIHTDGGHNGGQDGSREWLKLSQYAAQLEKGDWQEVTWPSEQGGQKMYAHLIPTWIRKLGPTLLLITCHDLDDPLKSVRYWGSTVLDLDAQALVDILAVRWQIETFFEYAKDLLGSDQYQVMSAQAILRFWTLIACLLCFLEEQRTVDQDQYLTCGDVRRNIQHQHRLNLLHWLDDRFKQGFSIDQVCCQLALSNS
jgi:hypothetical protein